MRVDTDIEKVISTEIKNNSLGIVWFKSNAHEDTVIFFPECLNENVDFKRIQLLHVLKLVGAEFSKL